MRRTELTKKTASKKGYTALGAAVATATLAVIASPAWMIAGVPATAWFTYRWLKYRAQWGLRF